jgi:hypothetical protein
MLFFCAGAMWVLWIMEGRNDLVFIKTIMHKLTALLKCSEVLVLNKKAKMEAQM